MISWFNQIRFTLASRHTRYTSSGFAGPNHTSSTGVHDKEWVWTKTHICCKVKVTWVSCVILSLNPLHLRLGSSSARGHPQPLLWFPVGCCPSGTWLLLFLSFIGLHQCYLLDFFHLVFIFIFKFHFKYSSVLVSLKYGFVSSCKIFVLFQLKF